MKTCRRGHEITGDNVVVYRRADGSVRAMQCRECYNAARRRAYWQRKTAAVDSGPWTCPHGHKMTADNIYMNKQGAKRYARCRTCVKAAQTRRDRAAGHRPLAAHHKRPVARDDGPRVVRAAERAATRDPWAVAIFGSPR